MQLFIALAHNYGWQRGELIGLTVKQVDFFDTALRLNPGTTKNGEGREVRITDPALLKLLRGACEGKKPDDPLFTRDDGKPVKDFRGAWHNLCIRAEVGAYQCANCGAA
jgi:integrase